MSDHYDEALSADENAAIDDLFDRSEWPPQQENKMQPAETPKPSASTAIGVFLKGGARLYTYQCERPVEPGDLVNVKLPSGHISTVKVEEVHERPQLSTKFETKWCVVVKTRAQAEADSKGVAEEVSELSKSLGL